MPRLCIKCDTRVEPSLIKPTYYCPECNTEVEKKDTYRVGRRFFQGEAKELRDEKVRQKRKKLKDLKVRQRRQAKQKKK